MPDFISGVYNYCDRWCERCPLTARCRSFAMEQALREGDDVRADFWEQFGLQTPTNPEFVEMLAAAEPDEEDWSESLGLVWRDADEEDEFDRARRDPLAVSAHSYGMATIRWLKQHDPRPEGTPTGNVTTDGATAAPLDPALVDALEVVGWYSLQIGVKIIRALGGELALADLTSTGVSPTDTSDGTDDDLDPPDDWDDDESLKSEANIEADQLADELDGDADSIDDDPWADGDEPWSDDVTQAIRDAEAHDRDGSAKVALLGLERSLGAWTLLRDFLPAQQPAIRAFQRHVARLRVELERRVPGARTFCRPGFDDGTIT